MRLRESRELIWQLHKAQRQRKRHVVRRLKRLIRTAARPREKQLRE